MKKKLYIILPAVSLLLAGLIILNIFIIKPKNLAEGFDGDYEESCVVDDAGIFDDDPDTLDDLNDLAQEYSEELELNIHVYLSGTHFYTDEEVEIYCDDEYDEIYGEDTDGIFYLMDLSGSGSPIDHISTSGKAVLQYDDNIESIFTTLDYYLPSGGEEIRPRDIERAVQEFFSQLETSKITKHGIFTKYHDKSSGKYYYYKDGEYIVSKKRPLSSNLLVLLISAVIGAVAGFITYLCIKSKYKFKSSTNPDVYVSHEESRLTEQSDTFIRSYVTKRKIESSSGGGSHSGGGGHSHSGGHGGGSHHR